MAGGYLSRNPRNLPPVIARTPRPSPPQLPPTVWPLSGYRFSAGRTGSMYGRGFYARRRSLCRRLPRRPNNFDSENDDENGLGGDGPDDDDDGSDNDDFGPDDDAAWQDFLGGLDDPIHQLMFINLLFPGVCFKSVISFNFFDETLILNRVCVSDRSCFNLCLIKLNAMLPLLRLLRFSSSTKSVIRVLEL